MNNVMDSSIKYIPLSKVLCSSESPVYLSVLYFATANVMLANLKEAITAI